MQLMRALFLLAVIAAAASAQLAPYPDVFPQFLDDNGAPLAFGTMDVFMAGTTTRTNSYQDALATIPNANPVVLDSGGRASIWLGGLTYKLVLKNAGGSVVRTQDNVPGSSPQVRRVVFLDNSGQNNAGNFTAEADLATGQCVWSVRDPTGTLPFILDCINHLATLNYNTAVGNGTAARDLTVYGNETVVGNLTVGGCSGCSSNSGTPVSATNPMYLYAHFRDDDQNHTYLSYSFDGVNFSDVNKNGSIGINSPLRDPTITRTADGIYHFMFTPNVGVVLQYVASPNLTDYATFQSIDMAASVPGATNAWAPEFFHDPVSGNDYFVVAVSTDNAAHFTPYLCQINLANGTLMSAQPLTLNGTSRGQTFDYFLYYNPGNTTYYMAYADQSATSVQRIQWATASTLTGVYTQQLTSDYFGFTDRSEAPAIVALPNGCVRLYADVFIDLFPSFRKYAPRYRDSCSATPFASLVGGSSNPINISAAEHGTIIKLTTDAMAANVFSAQKLAATDAYVNTRFGVGTANPFYTVTAKSKAANGGLQYDEPATFGADPGNGEAATWSACSDADVKYCPPPYGGSGRWIMNFNSAANAGMVQFNNTNVGGPSAIQFSNGLFTYGQNPAAVNGGKAIWEIGEDNACFGPVGACGNQANDWFYIHSGGTNDFPFTISPTTGEIRLSYGATFGGGAAQAFTTTRQASLHSPAAGVLDLGAGTFTEVNPTGKLRLGALSTGNTANTDLAGALTIGGGGTVTYTFGGTYTQAPKCVAGSGGAHVIGTTVTTTVLTIAGTAGDTASYICVAQN